MEPLKQDRIRITGTPPTTRVEQRTLPTRAMVMRRTFTSCGSLRPDQEVETGLSHVLNLRVGCWRPPVHVDLPR
jgi:hypothetical protein